jgi:hypothetical protein
MPETHVIARKLARPLAKIPGADAACRDVLAGTIPASAWADTLVTRLPDAWKMLDNGDLTGGLVTRWVSPAVSERVLKLEAGSWGPVAQILTDALREDGRVVFDRVARDAIHAVVPSLPAIRDGDAAALEAAIARLSVPFEARRLAAVIEPGPAFAAALAEIDRNPPPVPQPEPGPPPRDPMADLKRALGRAGALFGAFTGRSDLGKQAEDLADNPSPSLAQGLLAALGAFAGGRGGPATAEPRVLARHPAPVVAARIDDDDILTRDAAGGVLRTTPEGASAPGTWPSVPAFEADQWPPTPGPVLGHLPLADRMIVVGAEEGGGFACVGTKGRPAWDVVDRDSEEPYLCVASHDDGFVIGVTDGSVRLLSWDLELETGADVPPGGPPDAITVEGVEIPLSGASVRAVAVRGDDVYAGLHDGRVVHLTL